MSSSEKVCGSIPASMHYLLKSDQLLRNSIGAWQASWLCLCNATMFSKVIPAYSENPLQTFGFALSSTWGCDLIITKWKQKDTDWFY